MQHFQDNDIGVPIRVTVTLDGVAVNISSATTRQILIQRIGGGAVKVLTAAFETDGTDGKLLYSTVTGDLTPPGEYQIQVRLAIIGTYDYRTDVGKFEIGANLS